MRCLWVRVLLCQGANIVIFKEIPRLFLAISLNMTIFYEVSTVLKANYLVLAQYIALSSNLIFCMNVLSLPLKKSPVKAVNDPRGLVLILAEDSRKVLHTSRNLCLFAFPSRDDISKGTKNGRGLKTNAVEKLSEAERRKSKENIYFYHDCFVPLKACDG